MSTLRRPPPEPEQLELEEEDILHDNSVSMHTYDELELFAKYSSAVYQFLCPRPLGNSLVQSFSNVLTHAHGFVVRDDRRQEIVVAFRGSHELADMVTDGNLVLIPLVSRGIEKNNTASVHAGFLISYNSVRAVVVHVVRDQLLAFPNYTVVISGHSLGGSLASIAAVSVKSNIPSAAVRLFTYGQPRTGNAAYADLVEYIVGSNNIFRGKFPSSARAQFDGVPTMVPENLGYHHHAHEYWQFEEPANSSTIRRCEGQEDPECSHSIPSTGINPAHVVYFGQVMTMDATLCL
ncbi:Alpha/Beta hydrolase protein [Russula aff. rugulosa BPL654]|nr:Alpha/Beta hydrolase protein [Russula aff. rugulosa BPL654]